MTFYDFLYFTGYAVSACSIFTNLYKLSDRQLEDFVNTVFIAIFGGLLSWGYVIFVILRKKCLL